MRLQWPEGHMMLLLVFFFPFIPLTITQSDLEVNFTGMPIPGKIGNWFESSIFVNNPSHCRLVEFNSFGDGLTTLSRLMSGKNRFFSEGRR